MAISKADARALAALIIDNVKDYTAAHPTQYAEFLKAEQERKQAVPQKKRRQARNRKEG